MDDTLTVAFNRIYETNKWECGSGVGSKEENVIPYVQFLSTMIERYSIKSVLDVGCGDWTFSRKFRWDGIHYLGIDVADFVIKNNKKLYESLNIHFLHGDIFDVPNSEKYELVILKDVLQHLSFERSLKILDHIKPNKYLIITNDHTHSNKDIKDGEGWPLNICLPPFNMVPTHRMAFDAGPSGKVSYFIKQQSPLN